MYSYGKNIVVVKIIRLYSIKSNKNVFNNCIMGNEGDYKTRDRMGLTWTRSRVLAFGTIGSRVPCFDVIAITDLSVPCLWLIIIVTR